MVLVQLPFPVAHLPKQATVLAAKTKYSWLCARPCWLPPISFDGFVLLSRKIYANNSRYMKSLGFSVSTVMFACHQPCNRTFQWPGMIYFLVLDLLPQRISLKLFGCWSPRDIALMLRQGTYYQRLCMNMAARTHDSEIDGSFSPPRDFRRIPTELRPTIILNQTQNFDQTTQNATNRIQRVSREPINTAGLGKNVLFVLWSVFVSLGTI